MTRPEDPFEALSYDLNKFRERRMAERRSVPRSTADRRKGPYMAQPPAPSSQSNDGGSGTPH